MNFGKVCCTCKYKWYYYDSSSSVRACVPLNCNNFMDINITATTLKNDNTTCVCNYGFIFNTLRAEWRGCYNPCTYWSAPTISTDPIFNCDCQAIASRYGTKALIYNSTDLMCVSDCIKDKNSVGLLNGYTPSLCECKFGYV